jgi:hypothetical protein
MMRMGPFTSPVADFAAKWIGRGVKWAVRPPDLGLECIGAIA